MPLFNLNIRLPIASGGGDFPVVGIIIIIWIVLGVINFLGRKLAKQHQNPSAPTEAAPGQEEETGKSELEEFLETLRKQAEARSLPPSPPPAEIREAVPATPPLKIALKRSAAATQITPPPEDKILPSAAALGPAKGNEWRARILLAGLRDRSAWPRAIVMREIFGQPVGLRRQNIDVYQG